MRSLANHPKFLVQIFGQAGQAVAAEVYVQLGVMASGDP
jgi:hypothetical protein